MHARRRGRPRGKTRCREQILAAAQRLFAEHGYTETTLRKVAKEAQVDPALVPHYFDSKDGLFEAALRAEPPIRGLAELGREGDVNDLGERLARFYLGLWDDPATGARLLAVVRGTFGSSNASAMVAKFMTDAALLPLAREINADRPELRAGLAVSHLLGAATARYVLKIAPVAAVATESLVGYLAPLIQHCLTGELDSTAELALRPAGLAASG